MSIRSAQYQQLIKAGLIPWIIRQRSLVNKHGSNVRIVEKSQWNINPYGIEAGPEHKVPAGTLIFGAQHSAYDASRKFVTYEVRCYINSYDTKIVGFEWDGEIPDAVLADPEPPPDYGAWS